MGSHDPEAGRSAKWKRRKNIDRVRCTYGGDEKYIQYFGGKARRKDLGVEGKMILKLNLQK